MSDLTEALAYFDEMGGGINPASQEVAFDCLDWDQQLAITAAARLVASGEVVAKTDLKSPTDRQVEALGRYMNPGPWWDEPDSYKASIVLYAEQARDMLEFVAGLWLEGEA